MTMQKRLTVRDREFEYILRVSGRARRMRLTVHRDARVVVTLPCGTDVGVAERFVVAKSRWVLEKLERFRENPLGIATGGTHRDFLRHKERARVLAQARIAHFNQTYGLRFNKISIKNQRTLWGSCSQKGNLNFHYKIALLPPALADYIIVHELCHLTEFSHSKKFWHLVSQAIPDHAALRRALKKTGTGLC